MSERLRIVGRGWATGLRRGGAPRKVLMTCDALGGLWGYTLELCRGLGRRGVEVVLACLGPEPDPAQLAAARRLSNVTLCAADYRLEWMEEPWDDLRRAGDWLLGLAALHRPDVIHLNELAHGVLPWEAPVLLAGHACISSWFAAVRGQLPGPEWRRYRRRVAEGLHGADMVVTPTRAMLGALSVHYGPPARARVVPHGLEAGDFPPDEKQPLIAAVGHLRDEARNLCAVVHAARDLPWSLALVGSSTGPLPRHVRAIDPARPSLSACLGRAAIFALPARYEPFGLAPLEAALAGCALVLGDIPALREVWQDAALWVDPADPGQLKSALQGLIDDARARLSLAGAARRRALGYSAARMVTGYLDCYRALLGERESGQSALPRRRSA